jgi:hypothetical protein
MFQCTACHQWFQVWSSWQQHRLVIPPWQMHMHHNHTRRCMTRDEWGWQVLAQIRQQMKHTQEVCV